MITQKLEMEAKRLLSQFLKDTLSFLNHLVNEGYDSKGRLLFIEGELDGIRAAWKEFQEDFDLERANGLIKETSASYLLSHGLYGRQLELKLRLISNWHNRFSKMRTKKILLKALDATDTLLDSLTKATGIDEALKEIKDILRNSIDED